MRAGLLLVILGLVAGCSGLDTSTTSDDAGDAEVAEPERSESGDASDTEAEAPADADDGEAAAGTDALEPISATLGRRVIRTAEIELRVEDPDEAVDEVGRVTDRAGGFVATTDLARDDDDVLRGTLTLRVPSADLLEVLGDLEDLAVTAPVSRIDERDVTTETADLEARQTNLTTYEQELRTLLGDVRDDTSSPDDLLHIFERIREVRAEIDQIEGRLASLSDQVELATIAVTVEPAPSALPVADPAWQPAETLREAFSAAMRGVSRLVDGAIWLTVGVLPVALLVAAPAAALAVAWRRMRRRPEAAGPTL